MADRTQAQERLYMRYRGIETMDTQSDRVGLDPAKASWLENLQPIAPNKLLTVPGPGASIATLSANIARVFDATFTANGGSDSVNIIDWAVCFMSDGSAFVIQVATGAVTQFAVSGTFSQQPDCVQWKNTRILIADLAAGYCTYDNSAFVKQGQVSPNIQVTAGGSGYTGTATVTISGGTGSGATANPVVIGGSVTKIILTNGGSGYLATDTITVTINPVGGGSGATANGHVWPFVLSFNAFQLNPTIVVTNPGGYYYPTPPTVTVAPSKGATAKANVINGMVVSVTISSPGTGWLGGDTPTLTFSAPPASVTATATATFSSTGWTVNLTNKGYGYTSVPAITVSGGSGSGAAFAPAFMTNSSVGAVSNTALGTGYVAGDVVTLTFAAPPAASTATANVFIMATNNTTSTLAVFQGRVWLAGVRTLQWTGTGTPTFGEGFDDFNPADAAGNLTITDADLTHSVTALRNLNNYLYIFGDQSIKFVGSISVSGTTTNFSIITLASDQGCTYPMTIQSYNRFVFFANQVGVWAIYGATLQKVSDPMDGIFRALNVGADMQAAVVDMNNEHVYLLLVQALDYAGVLRRYFIGFQTKKWFVLSNSNAEKAVVMITTANQRRLFASSGTDFTPLVFNPFTAVAFVLQSGLMDNEKPEQGKRHLRVGIAQRSPDSTGQTITLLTESEQNSFTQTYAMTTPYLWAQTQANASGEYLGCTLKGTISNYTVIGITIEYEDTVLMKSGNLTN